MLSAYYEWDVEEVCERDEKACFRVSPSDGRVGCYEGGGFE